MYITAPSAKAQAIERIELLGQRYNVISTLSRLRAPAHSADPLARPCCHALGIAPTVPSS
jgi:hypothetical protein